MTTASCKPASSNRATFAAPRILGRFVFALGAIASFAATGLGHADIVIDTFATDQALLISSLPASPVTQSNSLSGPITGTAASTRTTLVALDAPLATVQASQLSSAIGRGVLTYRLQSAAGYLSATPALGRTTWTYAGGVNLAAGGDRFAINSTLTGGAATLALQLTDTAGGTATFQSVAPGSTTVFFNDTGWVMGGSWLGFGSVSSIALQWTASGPSSDQAYSVYTRVNGFSVVPTPGTIAIALAALVPLSGGRSRRRASLAQRG